MSRLYSRELRKWIAVSAQYLGWRPHEFWSATPSELQSALSDPAQGEGEMITIADIQHLLEREHHD